MKANKFKRKSKIRRRNGLRTIRSMFPLASLMIIIPLLLISCVYYNTFYNAQKYFESAQEQPIRDTGRPPPRAIQDYDKVIERCTYILTEHRDSDWADDALFLLARSMYYKKNNPLQARERFLDFLQVFSESEHIPEAHIYIARIDFERGDKLETHRRLQLVLDNPDYEDLHPEVLLLRSNYYLEDQDYARAQEYLQMIIDQYPRSQQFELAFFTLGQAHYEDGNFQESKDVFQILTESRASRRTKLNSSYYIALNLYHLNDYAEALEILDRLLRIEYEPAEFPKLNLLKARCLVGLKDFDEAEALFESVIANNSRTAIAAEASYYLAEMYFLELFRYEEAITYYNRIQTEYRSSPFVEKGVARSAVVSQIIQFNQPDRQISTQDLMDEQFKLAEYYLYVMNMPDSALSVYGDIEYQELRLESKLDSLRLELQRGPSLPDSLQFTDEGVEGGEMVQDSILIASLENEINHLEEDLQLFDQEFIPYSCFASAWIWYNIHQDETEAEQFFIRLKENYPDNRYTYATEAMLAGEEIVIATPFELNIEREYNEAVSQIDDNPEEAVIKLKSIEAELSQKREETPSLLSTKLQELHQKTIFTIGYTYYDSLADTLNARPYFEELLARDSESEYSRFIGNFYQDDSFIVLDTLPSFLEDEESEQERIDDATSTSEETEDDQELEEIRRPDSGLPEEKFENE